MQFVFRRLASSFLLRCVCCCVLLLVVLVACCGLWQLLRQGRRDVCCGVTTVSVCFCFLATLSLKNKRPDVSVLLNCSRCAGQGCPVVTTSFTDMSAENQTDRPSATATTSIADEKSNNSSGGGAAAGSKDVSSDASGKAADSSAPAERGSGGAVEEAESGDESEEVGLEDFWPVNAVNLLSFPRGTEILKEYFMGGLERYAAVRKFLRALHSLNGDGKPLVQFRVLTRGQASSTNVFLNRTELKRDGESASGPCFIHSVWDTHGNGYDAQDHALKFDEKQYGEAGNKLDMVEVFAAEIGAKAVLFAEDMRPNDRDHYLAWIEEMETGGDDVNDEDSSPPYHPPFTCKLLDLPYEAQGLSAEQLNGVLAWAKEQQSAGKPSLVVFDFDCTVTSFHFYKSLYWLRGHDHAALLKWIPARYFREASSKEKIMESLRYYA